MPLGAYSMLTPALEHFEHMPERAHARGHTGLGDRDDGVVFLARDAGDEPTVVHVVERLHDERAGVVGVVGVADVERDILLAHGEDRALVQHLRADEAQLTQLVIGDALDGQRVGHDAGSAIRMPDTSVQFSYTSASSAAAASAPVMSLPPREKGADLAVGRHAVKAGDDNAAPVGQPPERGVGRLLVDRAVKLKAHPQLRVQKRVAEVVRHEQGGEIFAARHELLFRDAGAHLPAQHVELGLDIDVQATFVADGDVAIADHLKDGVAVHAVLQVRVAQVQQVCELVVVRAALAGGGHDDHLPRGVGAHDVAHFFQTAWRPPSTSRRILQPSAWGPPYCSAAKKLSLSCTSACAMSACIRLTGTGCVMTAPSQSPSARAASSGSAARVRT